MTAAPSVSPTDSHAERPDVEHRESNRPLTAVALDHAGLALRKAWAIYIVLALIPPGAMIASIFALLFTRNDAMSEVQPGQYYGFGDFWGLVWLVIGMIWIGVTVPLGFFIRRAKWKAFYEGGLVDADDYLAGWLPIWIPLVIGGVLGFVGLALTAEVGNLFTSMLAFVVFLSMAPNGHALTRPVGDHDDPAVYEEPK